MNERLKFWREKSTAIRISARFTLPFDKCTIIDHDREGVTVLADGAFYCVPFAAIAYIREA